jgi:hypothetical protein
VTVALFVTVDVLVSVAGVELVAVLVVVVVP